MITLTGLDINGRRITVECTDQKDAEKKKRAFAKRGVRLQTVGAYAKEEGKRIVRDASH